MAILFRGVQTANTAYGSSFTVNKPSGVVDGDFMLLQVSASGEVDAFVPSGFSLVNQIATGGGAGNNHTLVYTKVASSEPVDYEVTTASPNFVALGLIAWYSDTNDEIAVDDSEVYVNDPATTAHLAASANVTESAAVLHCFYTVENTINGAPPGGMTERWDLSSLATIYLMTQAVGRGATGTRTMTGDNLISASISVVIVEMRHRFWPSSDNFFSIVYNGVDITRFCTQGELAATYTTIETTRVGDRQAQELPLRRTWTVGIGGLLDKMIDDVLGIDGATRPSPYRDLIITIAEGYSLLTHTWTGTVTEGAFIENYTVAPTGPDTLITWSAALAISGPPVVTEGA